MNPLAFVSALLALTSFSLALFILKVSKKFLHSLWAYFNFSVGIWGAGICLAALSKTQADALIFWRFAHGGGFFVSVLFYHVARNFCNVKESRLLKVFYLEAVVFFVLNIFGVTGYAVRPTFGEVYYVKMANFIYVLVTIFWFTPVIVGHIVLYKSFRLATGHQRDQIKYLLLSMFVGFSGGAQHFLPVYGINIYPYGNLLITVYTLLATYAIFRHKLLDIQVIIRRTIVFTGLLAFVFGIYSMVTMLVKKVLSDYFFVSDFWTSAFSIFLIVLGYDPIRQRLINWTDRFLFQKAYDYHKVLKDASRGMAKIESLRHLLGLVLHFVTMKMRIENASVLSLDGGDRVFRLVAARGHTKSLPKLSLSYDHPLVLLLSKTHEPVQLHEITERLESGAESESKNDLQIICAEMKTLEAKCAIPSFLGNELKNVLLIGDKKSGEALVAEDISLLMTLAQESSIALENARLYDEAIKKQRQLGQINEQLEHSKRMLVNALSEAEGANKQLQDTQAQLIHEQKMATLGRLAASVGHEVNNPLTILSMNVSRAILKFRKNPELKVSEILDVFDKMEKNIERIKAVVNTLTGLLKKSEKGKFEPLSLKLILEETLPLVQFQTYMDNLTGTEVELNVPGNIPLIRGDLERLQEIFLNLFINAYHAMANKRFRKIRVDAELDQEVPGMVAVNFTDNGSGMSEETMKKIFNYGYTTKPPGKGSGLGLYMCKYIVELHGGTIRVKSKLGEGTTFTVTLPIYKEEPTAASASQPKPGDEGSKSSVA